MIKKNAFITILSLLFFTPAWGNVADAPWPMLQHDIFHQGFSTVYGPNLNYAALAFTCNVAAEGTAPAVVDKDGTAYIGSTNGCLYKVHTDGTQECIYKSIEGSVSASAALDDNGTLYIGSSAGKLYAIATDGTLKWVFATPPGEPILSSPAIGPGGMIFFGTGPMENISPGALYCLTPQGDKLWSYSTGAVGPSSPAIDRYGNIYICSYNGTVHAVSGSGTLLWSYAGNGNIPITSSPVIAQDGAVYITNLSSLIALDFDLSFKWKFEPTSKVMGRDLGSGIMGPPVILPNGNIIIGGMLGDMHCIDTDGKEIWSQIINKLFFLPAVIRSSPIIDKNSTIYVRSQNFIYALDPSKGFVTSKIQLPFNQQDADSAFDGSPVLGTRRMLYMCSGDGNLYAVGPDTRRGSLAGSITGDIPATGIKVQAHTDSGLISTQKPDIYEAPVEADGSYTVPDIYPGSYIVTPICQNPFTAVEPAFRKITLLQGQNKTGIDFTIPPNTGGQYPYITMADATPNPLLLPGQHTLHIDARILAATPVTWAIDLSELGLPDNKAVQTPDPAQAACSWDIDVTGTDILGARLLMVSATDANGKVARRPVFVDFQHHNIREIDNGSSANFSADVPQQHFDGSLFKILFKYSPPAGPSPKQSSGSTKDLAGSVIGQLLLRIFSPSNTGTPDYTVPVTTQQQELQINNAEQGTWTMTVTSYTDTNVQCDLTSSIAGTGIVFGAVVDADSREPLNGASIQASLGTQATTEDGVYVLLSPSGVFNLTTSLPKYLPATKSVSLNAGSTVEKNMSLIPSNFSDNATSCFATAALGHATDKLDLLRRFRDTCLKKTPLGMAYSKKYYRFSPEITAMIAADPALRLQAQETLEAVLPLIQAQVGGGVVEPREFPDARIRACLEAFRNTASPELAREIDRAMQMLATKRFIDLIGPAR